MAKDTEATGTTAEEETPEAKLAQIKEAQEYGALSSQMVAASMAFANITPHPRLSTSIELISHDGNTATVAAAQKHLREIREGRNSVTPQWLETLDELGVSIPESMQKEIEEKKALQQLATKRFNEFESAHPDIASNPYTNMEADDLSMQMSELQSQIDETSQKQQRAAMMQEIRDVGVAIEDEKRTERIQAAAKQRTPQFETDDALHVVAENIPKTVATTPVQPPYTRPTELTDPEQLGDIIQKLEEERDRKAGVSRTIKDGVLIRDARNVKTQPQHGTEAFEMNYLNVARAALEVMEIEGKGKDAERLIIMQETEQFLKNFHKENAGKSQKDIGKAFETERNKLIEIVEQSGVKGAHKKMDVAANYQGLKDKTYAVSTLVDVKGRTIETTSVPKTKLTTDQRKEFEKVIGWKEGDTREVPKWFQTLSPIEKSLCANHADKIIAGHMIPTQLVNIPGMRNSFETVTRQHNKDGTTKDLDRNFHSGTLACLGTDDEASTQVTKMNIEQAKAMMQEEHPNGKTYVNTLNASNGNKNDKTLLERIGQGAKEVEDAQHANTCFNGGRVMGGSDYQAIVGALQEFANKDLGCTEGASLSEIGKNLKGRITKDMPKDHPYRHASALVNNLNAKDATQTSKTMFVARVAGGLLANKFNDKKALAYATQATDPDNLDLAINANLQALSNSLRSKEHKGKFTTLMNVISMCKSGKDRRGLSGHNVSAKAIERHNDDVTLSDCDKALLRGGHTAHMAGSVSAGGGGVGSMGTKGENLAGIPKSRRADLKPIIEQTAKYNKIKLGKIAKITRKITKYPKKLMKFTKKMWNKVTPKKLNVSLKKYKLDTKYVERVNAKKVQKANAHDKKPIQAQTREKGQIIRKALSNVKARHATAARVGGGRGQSAGVGM